MTALCSRVGCDEPAAAVFGFDAATALVWLDPFDGRAKGAGMLCAAHADTLTPMRGWTLQDRRVRAPRLWADRPRLTAPTRRPRQPAVAARSRHHHHGEGTDPLPFGTVGGQPGATRHPAGRGDRARVTTQVAEVADFDRLLDARTPLLTRAFQAARARESLTGARSWVAQGSPSNSGLYAHFGSEPFALPILGRSRFAKQLRPVRPLRRANLSLSRSWVARGSPSNSGLYAHFGSEPFALLAGHDRGLAQRLAGFTHRAVRRALGLAVEVGAVERRSASPPARSRAPSASVRAMRPAR